MNVAFLGALDNVGGDCWLTAALLLSVVVTPVGAAVCQLCRRLLASRTLPAGSGTVARHRRPVLFDDRLVLATAVDEWARRPSPGLAQAVVPVPAPPTFGPPSSDPAAVRQ